MFVSREEVRRCVPGPHRYDARVLQAGLGKDPWKVAIASMLLCRARRVQAEPVLCRLLSHWPTANALAVASHLDVEQVVRPCGFQHNRARKLVRFSGQYIDDYWNDLRQLVGVGSYVSDAVGLFCFGRTNLECTDRVLVSYVEELACELQHSATNASCPEG